MNKKELMAEIEKSLALLSRIPVVGDSVDAMAAAKAKMRKVYAELGRSDGDENE